MNTIKKEKKRIYDTPHIEMIKLDNEISLQLASNPDGEPGGDKWAMDIDYFNNDPYKKV